MLAISIVESPRRRRLVVVGKLIGPWAAELASSYQKATVDLNGRDLILDLKGVTAVSAEGERILLRLLNAGVKFRCGIYAKEVLRRLVSAFG